MRSRGMAIVLAGAALVAALVLFIVLNGGSDSSSAPSRLTTAIAFKKGAPVGGLRDLEVKKDGQVNLSVTPDIPAAVHVHGYDFEKQVKPGETARFSFKATAEGEFEIEVHHLVDGKEAEGVQVATLKVTP